ncbi:hypothetical protein LCGC14_2584740 [marine sediment metagenome]|uniref:Uncharacterized protein n=1 Tax=marine sediment metagenome TaxID=412755 RepID=A0A0F9ADA5_9ZZZZ
MNYKEIDGYELKSRADGTKWWEKQITMDRKKSDDLGITDPDTDPGKDIEFEVTISHDGGSYIGAMIEGPHGFESKIEEIDFDFMNITYDIALQQVVDAVETYLK